MRRGAPKSDDAVAVYRSRTTFRCGLGLKESHSSNAKHFFRRPVGKISV